VVSVSTSGSSPAFAARLRDVIARCIGNRAGSFATRLSQLRASRRSTDLAPSAAQWRSAISDEVLLLLQTDQEDQALDLVAQHLRVQS
jgi:siroheme synthase (precorrin-2 oxidase/ferrochelatase)